MPQDFLPKTSLLCMKIGHKLYSVIERNNVLAQNGDTKARQLFTAATNFRINCSFILKPDSEYN